MLVFAFLKENFDYNMCEAKVFDGVRGEVTFVWTCIKTMLSETTEDLTDMLGMFSGVVRVD